MKYTKLNILDDLKKLYGNDAEDTEKEVFRLLEKYNPLIPFRTHTVSEKDVILITYADTLFRNNEKPLKTLNDFLDENLTRYINSVHILPFFPFTSDDGFSVTDYYNVNTDFGSWEDIESLSGQFRLMFDAVVNHISKSSKWFQEFLSGNPEYKNYFIEVEENNPGLKNVFRPRALPLIHKYPTSSGEIVSVWTTFSEDQVDINFSYHKVFLKILDVLLFYLSKGARIIRLDAVGFLWKKLGTSCIHLPETHLVIQLYRKIIDSLSDDILLITETNVPHKDNISYFGNGKKEANMVYNFTLPPLLAYSIITQNPSKLVKWLDELEFPGGDSCYFNFTASHDGIGLQPVKDILNDSELKIFEKQVLINNGFISYKNNPDNTQSPYELNCTYLNLVSVPDDSAEMKAKKFLLSQALMLSVPGVPGIYIHSLLGSENDVIEAEKSGIPRRINRSHLNYSELISNLTEKGTLRNIIFTEYKNLIKNRVEEPFFNPYLTHKIKIINQYIFAIYKENKGASFWAVFNFSQNPHAFSIREYPFLWEIVGKKIIKTDNILISDYSFLWLKTL